MKKITVIVVTPVLLFFKALNAILWLFSRVAIIVLIPLFICLVLAVKRARLIIAVILGILIAICFMLMFGMEWFGNKLKSGQGFLEGLLADD